MYIAMLIGLMFVFPVASIAAESLLREGGALNIVMIGKWFVFWAVGMRLLIAGLRQIAQPRYTAEMILGIKAPDAMLIVRELGFANVAIGSAGVASLFLVGWALPLSLIGVIFYGLAGINHSLHKSRSRIENAAMVSDYFAAAVLLTILVVGWVAWKP